MGSYFPRSGSGDTQEVCVYEISAETTAFKLWSDDYLMEQAFIVYLYYIYMQVPIYTHFLPVGSLKLEWVTLES